MILTTNQKVRGSNPLQRAKNGSNTASVASVLFLFSRDSNPERVSGVEKTVRRTVFSREV